MPINGSGQNLDSNGNTFVAMMGSTIPDNQPVPIKNVGLTIVSTIVNAASVIAGGDTGAVSLGITTESEVWIQVNIDKQPWTLNVGAVNDVSGSYSTTVYPSRSGAAIAYPNAWAPAISLYLGMDIQPNTGLTTPVTMADARNYLIKPVAGLTLKVINNAATTATVTVKIVRIWR